MRGIHVDYATAGDSDKMDAILAAADPDDGPERDPARRQGRARAHRHPHEARGGQARGRRAAGVRRRQAREAGARGGPVHDRPRRGLPGSGLRGVGKGPALDQQGGGVWENDLGLGWVDPTDKRAQDYVIAVAKAAADAGFDEVMFDYVRFPTDGAVEDGGLLEAERVEGQDIAAFLQRAGQALRPEGVKVSAAVFGIQATSQADIGQDPALLKNVLDTIAPMVYPSHFGSGQFDIDNPTAHPVRHRHGLAAGLAVGGSSTAAPACGRGCRTSTKRQLRDGRGRGAGPCRTRPGHERLHALEHRGRLLARHAHAVGRGSTPVTGGARDPLITVFFDSTGRTAEGGSCAFRNSMWARPYSGLVRPCRPGPPKPHGPGEVIPAPG